MTKAKRESVGSDRVWQAMEAQFDATNKVGTKTMAQLAAELGMETQSCQQAVGKLRKEFNKIKERGLVPADREFPSLKDGRTERTVGEGENAQAKAILSALRSAGSAPEVKEDEAGAVTANEAETV